MKIAKRLKSHPKFRELKARVQMVRRLQKLEADTSEILGDHESDLGNFFIDHFDNDEAARKYLFDRTEMEP